MVWWTRLLWAVLLGLALGAVNSVVNVVGGPYSPHPLRPDGVWLLQLLGAVLGTTWAWAAWGFVCGWVARRWWEAPLLGVLGLWSADLAYYLTDWAGGITEGFSVIEFTWWAVLGAGAGAGMGLLAGLARRRHPWSLIPAIGAVVILFYLITPSGADVVRAASVAVQQAATAAFSLVLGVRWISFQRCRAQASRPRRSWGSPT